MCSSDLPHPFSPQECDSAVMNQEQNPLQRRKQQRIARNRRQKPLHHDRLTPTDLLKLIPSPIVLSDRSLAGMRAGWSSGVNGCNA